MKTPTASGGDDSGATGLRLGSWLGVRASAGTLVELRGALPPRDAVQPRDAPKPPTEQYQSSADLAVARRPSAVKRP
jgi:hypothetical protein